jgi:hypothetical protein
VPVGQLVVWRQRHVVNNAHMRMRHWWIPHIDTVFDLGFKLSHGATGFGETAGYFYFELRASLMR